MTNSMTVPGASGTARKPRLLGRFFKMTVSTLTIASLMAGCANVEGTIKQTAGGIENAFDNAFGNYIDDTDVCVNQRREMVDAASFFDQETLGGIAVAVGAGVVTGLLTQSVETGLIVTATLIAGVYLNKYLEEGRDATGVTSAVRNDVQKANSQIDDTLVAFKALDKCRLDEAKAIRAELRGDRITRTVAQEKMAAVKARRQEDIEKFRDLADNISESTVAYASAYNEIAANNNRRGFEIGDTGTVKRSRKRAKPKKANDRLTGASGREVQRLERDCLTNAQKRDECFDIADKAETAQDGYEI